MSEVKNSDLRNSKPGRGSKEKPSTRGPKICRRGTALPHPPLTGSPSYDTPPNLFNGNLILQKNHPDYPRNLARESPRPPPPPPPQQQQQTTLAIANGEKEASDQCKHNDSVYQRLKENASNSPTKSYERDVKNFHQPLTDLGKESAEKICSANLDQPLNHNFYPEKSQSMALVPVSAYWAVERTGSPSRYRFEAPDPSLPVTTLSFNDMFGGACPRPPSHRRTISTPHMNELSSAMERTETRFPWFKDLRKRAIAAETEEKMCSVLDEVTGHLERDYTTTKTPRKLVHLRYWVHEVLNAACCKRPLLVPAKKAMAISICLLDLTCRVSLLGKMKINVGPIVIPPVKQLVQETTWQLGLVLRQSTPHIYEVILRSNEMATTKYIDFCKPVIEWAMQQSHDNSNPIDYYRSVLVYSLLLKYEPSRAVQMESETVQSLSLDTRLNALFENAEKYLGKGNTKAVGLYAHTQAAQYKFTGSAVTLYLLKRERRENLLQGFFKYHGLMKPILLEIKCEEEHHVITLDDDEEINAQESITSQPPLALAGPSEKETDPVVVDVESVAQPVVETMTIPADPIAVAPQSMVADPPANPTDDVVVAPESIVDAAEPPVVGPDPIVVPVQHAAVGSEPIVVPVGPPVGPVPVPVELPAVEPEPIVVQAEPAAVEPVPVPVQVPVVGPQPILVEPSADEPIAVAPDFLVEPLALVAVPEPFVPFTGIPSSVQPDSTSENVPTRAKSSHEFHMDGNYVSSTVSPGAYMQITSDNELIHDLSTTRKDQNLEKESGRGTKRSLEEEEFGQSTTKRQYDPPLNLVTDAHSSHDSPMDQEITSFWDGNVVDSVDQTDTDCDLLSIDMELQSLMSLFTDHRDGVTTSPSVTPSKKSGSLEKLFRTPKFGFTGIDRDKSEKTPRKQVMEPAPPEEEYTSPPSLRTRSRKKNLAESVEKCKRRLSSHVSPKRPSVDVPPKPAPSPVKRKRGRPRKKRA